MKKKLKKTIFDDERMKKLRHGFKYFIKNKLNEQFHQTVIHANFLTQAQRIENIELAKAKIRQIYFGDVFQQNKNDKKNRRNREKVRNKRRKRKNRNENNRNFTKNSFDKKKMLKITTAVFTVLIKKKHQKRKNNNLCYEYEKSGYRINECFDKSKN